MNFSKRSKRSYHTDVILQYQLNALPAHLLDQIPSSTLHNWKGRNMDEVYGFSLPNKDIALYKALATKRTFSNLCRALYLAFSVYESIVNNLPNKKKVLLKSKELILSSLEKISSLLNRRRALKLFSLSPQQYNSWKSKGRCSVSPLLLCLKKHPLQISRMELEKIKIYFKKYPLWYSKSIYYQMMKDKATFLSLSSFYKYVALLGLKNAVPSSRRKKHFPGLRASAPKEIIHMDVTVFRPLDNSKVYIYLIVDNFSRCILSWKASLVLSGSLCLENLREAVVKHNLFNAHVDLIVDGGSENNCTPMNDFISSNGSISKLVAQKDILFSNSMVEAAHKHLKYQYLFKKDIRDIHELIGYMSLAVPDHSDKPHGALFGFSPSEVLNGAVPNRNLFKEDIRKARPNRVLINKGGCGRC